MRSTIAAADWVNWRFIPAEPTPPHALRWREFRAARRDIRRIRNRAGAFPATHDGAWKLSLSRNELGRPMI
jgi:hypothetical protein